MKTVLLTITIVFFTLVSIAQTDGISYQAVIIDNNPQEIPGVDIPTNNLPNVPLEVQFSIIGNSNTVEYQETHTTETDAFGMINLMIGQGLPAVGAFNEIYWNNEKFLKVEIDLFDGNGLVEFSYQGLTYIPYVKHREIIATSTLDVDGATTLNNNLTVANQSPTHLTGDLTVDGLVSFDGELTVGGDTQLYSDLTVSGNTLLEGSFDVDGVTNINNAFNVTNSNLAYFSGNVNVNGQTSLNDQLSVNATSDFNGQVTIDASVAGGQSSYDAYPLRVEGSPQGIAVRLTAGTPNNGNNFITFFNNAGNAVGRIEGETTGEVASSPEFIFDNAIFLAEEIKAIAAIPLAAVPVVTAGTPVAQAGPCTPCITMAAAELILATANLAAYNIFALTNLGVSYQSGSADYAEWLERGQPQEVISAGDIVGVNNGKISKFTDKAQKLLVISTKPAVLGNMPSKGEEHLYEKVAFMGQIPVKVRGVVLSGDYILPSGRHDGTGIAVSPEDIKAHQFRNIVGVAWSSSYVDAGVTLVNMAIGLNTNDVADLVAHQEMELKRLQDKFQTLEQRLLALENGTPSASNITENQAAKAENIKLEEVQSKHEAVLSTMPQELDDTVMVEAIEYLKQQYTLQGVDVKNHPGLNKLFTDESYQKEIIAKAQDVYRKSYQQVPGKN